ncbi:MAG TPA: histidine phosphatase family protein [Gemmatimonadales bacterium]|nr:histidine phosphatase family protein [Gemmatimonadales bacterium]
MVTVLLVRHATCDHVGRLIAGRAAGVSLNAEGRAEAERLADALCPMRIDAVYSGPLDRAMDTARLLAGRVGLPVRPAPGLDEMDFGQWTGRTLASLDHDPTWQAFNQSRDSTRIPGGELMAEAADRAMAELARFEREHPNGLVAAVSHADVIRGVLLRCLGLSLDCVHRLTVAPASVSAVRLFDAGAQVVSLNWLVGQPAWES